MVSFDHNKVSPSHNQQKNIDRTNFWVIFHLLFTTHKY